MPLRFQNFQYGLILYQSGLKVKGYLKILTKHVQFRNVMQTEFGKWLTKKYLEYQAGQGKRITIADFADYLGGVHQVTVSRWMNGTRIPDGEYLSMLASALGDEVYDVLRLPRPDKRLAAIITSWGVLSESQRDKLADDIKRFTNGKK